MVDVLIALLPVVLASVIFFGWDALQQLAVCVITCCLTEAILTGMRRKAVSLGDVSAVVTGMILALSLPWNTPLYVGVIASVVAIGLGKAIFGGLGQNLFNPAMVGRAFVMLSFAGAVGAPAYVEHLDKISGIIEIVETDAVSAATPMTAYKGSGVVTPLLPLLLGNTIGSLGETSALACLLGGAYLLIRRTASWQIPAGVILMVAVIAGAINLTDLSMQWTVLHELLGGALLFGTFFIATDPVTSPLTGKGKFIFGLGVGAFVMLIRTLSVYPEGVMFAILLMNSITPLINRLTVPRPLGGPVPAPAKK